MNQKTAKLLDNYAYTLNTDNQKKTKNDLKKFWSSLDPKGRDQFRKEIKEKLSKK
jgi:hypothetical protein